MPVGLIETATAELQVVAHVKKKPLALKATNSTSPTPSNLWELIPSLLSTVDKAGNSEQAALQAQVCLGWVHWTLNEPGLAATRLPKDFAATVDSLSTSKESLSPWTEVCLVKGCYIKGTRNSETTILFSNFCYQGPHSPSPQMSQRPWRRLNLLYHG